MTNRSSLLHVSSKVWGWFATRSISTSIARAPHPCAARLGDGQAKHDAGSLAAFQSVPRPSLLAKDGAPSPTRFLPGAGLSLLVAVTLAGVLGGCTAITVDPLCPGELRVGETGQVLAREKEPGHIASYLWEVFPATAGSFANPLAPDTTFQALEEGEATIRLTAGDGLYQVVAEGTVVIAGVADVAVKLEADPADPVVDDTVTLTCTAIGADPVSSFDILQTVGVDVNLSEIDPGVVRFTATDVDELTFRCRGTGEAGSQSEDAFVTVQVTTGSAGNDNANDNANDNTEDNTNNNASDNDNSNQNDNTAPDNTNDNA